MPRIKQFYCLACLNAGLSKEGKLHEVIFLLLVFVDNPFFVFAGKDVDKAYEK